MPQPEGSSQKNQSQDDKLRLECEQTLTSLGPVRTNNRSIYDHDRLVDALMRLCQRQRAETWRAAALLGDEQSPHHMECALKWGRKCEAKAKECEAQAAQAEKGGGDVKCSYAEMDWYCDLEEGHEGPHLSPSLKPNQCCVSFPHPSHDWCKGIPFPKSKSSPGVEAEKEAGT